MTTPKRYTRKDLRHEWKQQIFAKHHRAQVGDVASLEVRWVVGLFNKSCWCWNLVDTSPDTARRLITSGSLPDAKTVLQAQVMAEAAALAYAKALVTALEGGVK